MSPVVQIIGYIIVIPSIIGIFGAGLFFLLGILGVGASEAATTDAEVAGKGLAVLFTSGSSICAGITSLVGGLVGYLLIMKKKVWKCENCGFIMDRD